MMNFPTYGKLRFMFQTTNQYTTVYYSILSLYFFIFPSRIIHSSFCHLQLIFDWLVVSTPLKNMKVSWEYHSKYMEKKIFQSTNQLWSLFRCHVWPIRPIPTLNIPAKQPVSTQSPSLSFQAETLPPRWEPVDTGWFTCVCILEKHESLWIHM